MTRRSCGLLVALALALTGAGCGSSAAPPLATLPPRDVSYLPSTSRSLTASFLAREAQAPDLRARLSGWGFIAARQRYFQGESRRLQIVDSRTLRFSRAGGATAYVDFMRGHLGAYLGSFARLNAISSRGRTGFVATGQECQCHLASPSFLSAVARGTRVSWVEINGPGATRQLLATLLARAP